MDPVAVLAEHPSAPGDTVKRLPIVDRAIAFHGGELYRHSTAELDICSKSGCFHLWVKADGDAWEHRVSGQVRDRLLKVRATHDAVEAWEDGEPLAIAGKEQSYRDFAMARVYFPFLPYRLNDPSVLKQDLGLVDWEGRKLHRVKVTFESGSSTDADDEYMYWFDPETAASSSSPTATPRTAAGCAFAAPRTTAGSAAFCSSTRRTWGSRERASPST